MPLMPFLYTSNLLRLLKKKFKGINAIGNSIINKMAEEQDRKYINTYGWRSVLIIIFSGFSPESVTGVFFTTIIILILFTPVLAIPAIIIYGFPTYKLKCIEEAVSNILERERGDSAAPTNKARRYRIAVEYIKMTEFAFSPFVKRDKKFSDSEILEEVGE